MSSLELVMPPGKPQKDERAMGRILAENLIRLGYAEHVVKTTEVAKLVTEKTGKPMSRQRVSALLNAINIRPETIALIAKGLGVKPSELTKDSRGGKAK